jgi:hypothetical protein
LFGVPISITHLTDTVGMTLITLFSYRHSCYVKTVYVLHSRGTVPSYFYDPTVPLPTPLFTEL